MHGMPPGPGMFGHPGLPPMMRPLQGMNGPQGMPPHGMPPHGMPPHGMPSHGMPPGMPYVSVVLFRLFLLREEFLSFSIIVA